MDLWVIDAVRLVTHIHRDPADHRYKAVTSRQRDEPLVPLADAALAVTLGELDLR
jgi:hypothetical protein